MTADHTDHETREALLTALHDATRRMMAAEVPSRIAAIVVDAADDLLGVSVATVYLATDGDDLSVAATFAADDHDQVLDAERARGALDAEGTTVTTNPDDASLACVATHALGDHGVLAVGRDAGAFPDPDVELLSILATNAEVALDRAVQLRTLRNREQDLRDERNRLAALFENIPSPTASFVIEDGDPVVESVNSAFEDVFGYEEAELVGENIDEYIIPAGREGTADDYNEKLQQGKNVNVEVRRLTRSGPRDFLLDVVPFRLNAPNVHGYAMYTDITDRKHREQELERQNERLEEFASIVSHDLRNPLNVARGYLDIARDDPTDEHFDRIADALDRMDDLVESVLVLARHGRTVTETESVSLQGAATRAWRNVATKTAQLELEEATDRDLRADPSRLSTLFENLFRNSVEHVGPDVTVTVGVLSDGDGFFVADDGPGIPADERDQVFESGFTTRDGGTGFGLAIVTQVAEAHDWTVGLGDGAGARFEVRGVEWADD